MDAISVENCQPLNLNGGFEEDTPIEEGVVPVGWEFRNIGLHPAVISSINETGDDCKTDQETLTTQVDLVNFWQRFVEPQRYPGYRSFVQFSVGSPDTPIEAKMVLANRQSFNPWVTSPNQVPYPDSRKPYAGYADDLPYTLCFSLEVISGTGRIETYSEWDDQGTLVGVNDDGADISTVGQGPDLVAANLKAAAWDRFCFTGRFKRLGTFSDEAFLTGQVLRLVRTGTDPFVVKFTASLVVVGQYAEVPYPGDLSYMVDPRNTVVLVYGDACPPGFRELDEGNNLFLKGAIETAELLSTGGSEFHEHDVTDRVNGGTEKSRNTGSLRPSISRRNHSHPSGPGISVPSSRTVTLCVKR